MTQVKLNIKGNPETTYVKCLNPGITSFPYVINVHMPVWWPEKIPEKVTKIEMSDLSLKGDIQRHKMSCICHVVPPNL